MTRCIALLVALAALIVPATAAAVPPTASLSVPARAVVGERIAIDASGSTPASGAANDAIVKYEFDLDNNGLWETNAGLVSTVYSSFAAGSRIVNVRVWDADGEWDTETATIPVYELPTPRLSVIVPGSLPFAGDTLTFSAAASTDAGWITKYEWDLDGNGTFEVDSGATPTVNHVYATNGRRFVGLRVTNNQNTTNTLVVSFVVYPPAGTTGTDAGDGDGRSAVPSGFAPGEPTPPSFEVPAGRGAVPTTVADAIVIPVAAMTVSAQSSRVRAALTARPGTRYRIVVSLSPRDAKRLRLGKNARVLARRTVVVDGTARIELTVRLTAKTRRALRRAGRVTLNVQGTATGPGGERRQLAQRVTLPAR